MRRCCGSKWICTRLHAKGVNVVNFNMYIVGCRVFALQGRALAKLTVEALFCCVDLFPEQVVLCCVDLFSEQVVLCCADLFPEQRKQDPGWYQTLLGIVSLTDNLPGCL